MSIDPDADTEYGRLDELDVPTHECVECGEEYISAQALYAHGTHGCPNVDKDDGDDEDTPNIGSAGMLCLLAWLEDETQDGPALFKSKFITDDVGMSSKQIGTRMGLVDNHVDRFDVERLAYSSATQWRVTRSETDYWGGEADE